MQRFAPYLGVVAALALGVFIAVFSNDLPTAREPATPANSSTLAVVPDISFPIFALPGAPEAAQNDASIAPTAPATARADTWQVVSSPTPSPETSSPQKSPAASAPPIAPAPQRASPPSGSFNDAAGTLRNALVNILCYAPATLNIHSISGSGVIISPRGYILTNAHVAQYFLLTDRGVSCTVRTGSPAQDAYTADLAFISPAWIRANTSVIKQSAPLGNGEYDYAILAIAGAATSTPLPAAFPYISPATTASRLDAPVVIASYGAQFLSTDKIQSSLYPTIVLGSIQDIFTFGTNTVDELGLGGSAAAQEGSSGGGVASFDGKLAGIITTSTVTGEFASRSLAAITASYIRRAYENETGVTLESLLVSATSTAVASFASDRSALESVLLSMIGM